MYRELFELPIIHVTIKSYGLMMVIGFLMAVTAIRILSRDITKNPQHITNAALYALIAGVIGARVFHVVHYFGQYRDNLLGVFAIWNGGLEFYGGVILAVIVILSYLYYNKLPIRRYADILAIGLMLGLAFGRIGCFLNGCCYGKPTDVPWAVRFPSFVWDHKDKEYKPSFVFESQIYDKPERKRFEPQLELPDDYFGYTDENGIQYYGLKPFSYLTEQQQYEVTQGQYRSLPVHPTQLYTSFSAAVITLLLYLFWRRSKNAEKNQNKRKLFIKPGSTFSLMFILYGIMRFTIECFRDDNPFEYGWWIIYKGGTVSQNLSIYMIVLGVIFMAFFEFSKAKPLKS